MSARPWRGTALAVVAAAVLTTTVACGSVDQPAAAAPAETAVRALPDGVHDPAVLPPTATKAGSAACTDPQASYRPFPSVPQGPTLDAIRRRGTLRVGVGQTSYLMSYLDPNTGQLSGFEVEIVKAIAKLLLGTENVTWVTLNPQDWPAALETNPDGTLKNKAGKSVDMVLGDMTMTCTRWALWSFSTEYLPSGQRLLVNRNSGVTSLADLGGHKVCASANSTNLRYIAEAPTKNHRPIDAVSAVDESDCMVLLQEGVVDGVSTDDAILAGLAQQDRTTQVVGPTVAVEPAGIGMKSSQIDLIRFVNGALAQIRGDGLADRSKTEWISFYDDTLLASLGAATPPVPHYKD
jgi:polar amino acid transport system substrate-binding protein